MAKMAKTLIEAQITTKNARIKLSNAFLEFFVDWRVPAP